MSERVVGVDLPAGSPARYAVVIGHGLLAELGPRVMHAIERAPRAAAVIVDTGVPEALADAACASLEEQGTRVTRVPISPSEKVKSLATVEGALRDLAAAGLDRDDVVIAIGGGIVGDIAGFVAASYRRGLRVVQCPTTLLSMVDASVGGKTGVNLSLPDGALVKNAVGAFWQPSLVLADADALASLEPRVYRCGLAECTKHGMLAGGEGDAELFDWLREHRDAIAARDRTIAAALIERNVRVKARVVASDERESAAAGGRALLNLGHTFAHAIETLPGLSPSVDPGESPIQHGEAVALGLVAATVASADAGLCEPSLEQTVRGVVRGFELPDQVAGLPDDGVILGLMTHDKKARGGRVRYVLPVGAAPGRCRVVDHLDEQHVRAGLASIRGSGA